MKSYHHLCRFIMVLVALMGDVLWPMKKHERIDPNFEQNVEDEKPDQFQLPLEQLDES